MFPEQQRTANQFDHVWSKEISPYKNYMCHGQEFGFSTHGTTSILETSGCPLPGTACWSFGQCQKGLLSKKQRAQFPAWDGMTIADMGVRGKKSESKPTFFNDWILGTDMEIYRDMIVIWSWLGFWFAMPHCQTPHAEVVCKGHRDVVSGCQLSPDGTFAKLP